MQLSQRHPRLSLSHWLDTRSRLVRVASGAMALGILGLAMHSLGVLGGSALDSFFKDWVYTATELIAVLLCGARVLRRREDRLAWGLMTAALLTWTAGDLVWTLWLNHVQSPPTPSVADGFYLAMFPLAYAAVMLLIRSRLPPAGAAQWLDGAVVGLAIAAVGTALVLPTLVAEQSHHLLADATNLAYPIGDLALLVFVVLAYTLAAWRPGRLWLWLGSGIGLTAIADLIYLVQTARDSYVAGGILDALWPLSMALLAVAAWQPNGRQRAVAGLAPPTIVVTLLSALGSLAVLVAAAFRHVAPAVVCLAAAALAIAIVRAILTYLEYARMLRSIAEHAVTDSLTGLGNRRRLMTDLEQATRRAAEGRSSTLVFFDLNGFKRYNDSFGHGPGDTLLRNLSTALSAVVTDHGTAYRPGGDEFCVVLSGRHARHDPLVDAMCLALTERGSGFTVGASCGVVSLPEDAASASAALQLADQRMYADKHRSGRQDRAPTRDVLMQVLSERTPGLHEHVSGVGRLVRKLGRDLALDSDQLDELLRAAELHDIGKLAIPDEILGKPGPLTPSEWTFIQQHPVIGERILNADPAMRPVARLVRASHERWDGTGYPDRLAAAAIPLGARIIAACDALEAMTSERCYQRARNLPAALDELRRCAGGQFDPAVVEALCRRLSEDPELLSGEALSRGSTAGRR
ncbi:MAG TPA: diguanylate cyclase [Solirubrobacteraceae bacterium]|nr:diguanylate cyclase [Solirubrobacteraceae bacterium]